jgi:hypothetical protein
MSKADDTRARWKALGTVLMTYGFALVGGLVIQMLKDGKATWVQIGAFAMGVVLNGLAVYIAPRGEKP